MNRDRTTAVRSAPRISFKRSRRDDAAVTTRRTAPQDRPGSSDRRFALQPAVRDSEPTVRERAWRRHADTLLTTVGVEAPDDRSQDPIDVDGKDLRERENSSPGPCAAGDSTFATAEANGSANRPNLRLAKDEDRRHGRR
jgi:hypothetical protein